MTSGLIPGVFPDICSNKARCQSGPWEIEPSTVRATSSNMLSGRIDINQISATSKINIPKHSSYYAKIKGVSNKIFYTIDDNPADSKANKTSENLIELNGIGSELIVNEYSKEDIHG